MGVGQGARASTGSGPQVHTVAGVGVAGAPVVFRRDAAGVFGRVPAALRGVLGRERGVAPGYAGRVSTRDERDEVGALLRRR
ncbi:hypothetical protein FB384_005153 [Prauserella sediminis]|uniref:Uncharacterized protein n=1 Tax=Prauserella sediminis TaxID=577680 RepID=A0A839XQV4_9PSEU|nr:hypothetical protein [Prauserella sediminis]